MHLFKLDLEIFKIFTLVFTLLHKIFVFIWLRKALGLFIFQDKIWDILAQFLFRFKSSLFESLFSVIQVFIFLFFLQSLSFPHFL